jgi:hypothetical protein
VANGTPFGSIRHSPFAPLRQGRPFGNRFRLARLRARGGVL